MKRNKGITLVALVITVIILLILAGVAISMITGGEGLFARANKAAGEYNNSAIAEEEAYSQMIDILAYQDGTKYSANAPKLTTGMKAVIFNTDGTTREPANNEEWYNYKNKQWANAETEDGSLWVWIPRFAYKITYYTDGSKNTIQGTRDVEGYKKADGTTITSIGTDEEVNTVNNEIKSIYGSIDIVFLQDQGNQYYKEVDGKIILANAVDDGYIIHPAFKDGRGNYDNGEWRAELTGFWIAKFEAGFQQGNAVNTSENDTTNVQRSSVSYSSPHAQIRENLVTTWNTARNYIDGIYSKNTSGDLEDITGYEMLRDVKISYPVFKGANYVMNYICIQDAYKLCRAMAEDGNMYGLSSSKVDTHLIKNSEYGACAYLSYSQYGAEGKEPYINNLTLNDDEKSVYTVTGFAGKSQNASGVTSIQDVNIWYTPEGQKGSSNYNITGVYDMSGCAWQYTSAIINNNSESIMKYGQVFLDEIGEGKSTEYITIYNHVTLEGMTHVEATRANFNVNLDVYGDAVAETSVDGYSTVKSWDGTTSLFLADQYQFSSRGNSYNGATKSGIFSYTRGIGRAFWADSFRAVIVNI